MKRRPFSSRPRIDGKFGDRGLVEAEAEPGPGGDARRTIADFELCVDQIAEVKHLVVGEELDERRVGGRRGLTGRRAPPSAGIEAPARVPSHK